MEYNHSEWYLAREKGQLTPHAPGCGFHPAPKQRDLTDWLRAKSVLG